MIQAKQALLAALADAVADVAHRIQPAHVLLLEEIDRVGIAFREQRDQHIGAGDRVLARGLDVQDRALDHPLETGGRLRIGVLARLELLVFLVEIAAERDPVDESGKRPSSAGKHTLPYGRLRPARPFARHAPQVVSERRRNLLTEDRFCLCSGEALRTNGLSHVAIGLRVELGIEKGVRQRTPYRQAARNFRLGKLRARHAPQSPVKIRSTSSPTLGV